MAAADDDAAVLERTRADLRSERAHFNHAGMSLTPAPVLARVHAHLDLEADVGGYEAAASVAGELTDGRAALGRFLGAGADDITVTESATAASEAIFWALAESFDYGAGDRILVDQFAYATVYTALCRLGLARGAEVVAVPSHPDGTIDPGALAARLDDRTRLVLVTHMPTHVGTVTDLDAVAAVLAGSNAVFAVDVAQTLGQLPIDLAAIGCQVAFAPGRKFLRAPRGTGILYVRSELAERLVPLTPPFGSAPTGDGEGFELPPGARRFDQFEYGVAARLGLGAAVRYAIDIGMDRIARLVAERSDAVIDVLGAFDAIRLVGTVGTRGIVSFVHASLDPHDVAARCAAAGVNVWVNVAAGAPLDAAARPVLPSVRVSPHYVTDDTDLGRLHQVLRSLP